MYPDVQDVTVVQYESVRPPGLSDSGRRDQKSLCSFKFRAMVIGALIIGQAKFNFNSLVLAVGLMVVMGCQSTQKVVKFI